MKLKKIENAVVHCKTKEEAKQLVNCYNHYYNKESLIGCWDSFKENTCYKIEDGYINCYCDYEFYIKDRKITEFPDLIEPEPELTAEEVLEWLKEHYDDNEYENAFGNDYTCYGLFARVATSEIIEKISKWKADHEKREPGKERAGSGMCERMQDYRKR